MSAGVMVFESVRAAISAGFEIERGVQIDGMAACRRMGPGGWERALAHVGEGEKHDERVRAAWAHANAWSVAR